MLHQAEIKDQITRGRSIVKVLDLHIFQNKPMIVDIFAVLTVFSCVTLDFMMLWLSDFILFFSGECIKHQVSAIIIVSGNTIPDIILQRYHCILCISDFNTNKLFTLWAPDMSGIKVVFSQRNEFVCAISGKY